MKYLLAILMLFLPTLALAGPVNPPSGSTPTPQVLTTGTSFTTSNTVQDYRIIVIGPGGGGGSSTGAGSGGSGASGNISTCEVVGGGQVYTYQIGQGGVAGTAGISGSAGTATFWSDSTNCAATSGNGGTNGTASAGAGGTQGSANTCAQITALTNNVVGTCIVTKQGLAGSSGSAFQPTTYGVGKGGAGCAAANCVADTAGTNGEIIVIPEL